MTRFLLSLALSLSLTTTPAPSFAAPLPRGKVKQPPPDLVAGEYVLTWSGSNWRVLLTANGSYECRMDDVLYRGIWSYDPKTRSVRVHERWECVKGQAQPGDWLGWDLKLDAKLTGKAMWLGDNEGGSGIPCSWQRVSKRTGR